jgi:6-phosphogluconolactonase (cycloisomerase 2 family)
MPKRYAWLLGLVVLVLIALLVACGTTYNKSSDGLVLVGSQGSNVIQSFSFGLNNGHISAISNPPATSGTPSALALDPAGAYAYVIINQSGIAAFKVNSDGTMTAAGSPATFNQATVVIQGAAPPNNTEKVSVLPSTMVMDAAGKFLFVADRATTDGTGNHVPGAVSVFTISNGTATEVAGSPFFTVVPATATLQPSTDIVGVAATPTVFPKQNAVCSLAPVPKAEYLYAVDSVNYLVWEFAVNTSTGALGIPGSYKAVPGFATDAVPAGVAVDACNRFVYVSGSLNNKVSAYTMCNGSTTQSQTCPVKPDGSLVEIFDSPFSMPSGVLNPGPMVVDPFGNYLYVLGTNSVLPLHISTASGSLTAGGVVSTGSQPKSIAIRSDDMWLFVANYQSATLSQYSITPASGALNPLPGTTTDNYPWGVAVK